MPRQKSPVAGMVGSSDHANPRPSTPTPLGQTTITPTTPPRTPPSPSVANANSPRSPRNTPLSAEQQRRNFMRHLNIWSLNHDASPYFNGKLSFPTQTDNIDTVGLGKSNKCVLSDSTWTDARKQVVIRLFPPGGRDARYKLLFRYGAGWMTSRDFLNMKYFNTRHVESRDMEETSYAKGLDDSLRPRASSLGPKPADKDSVTVRPLFPFFQRLPLELRQMILGFAADVSGHHPPLPPPSGTSPSSPSPISKATMMSISKSLNSHLVPWIYNTTDFRFGTTGLTNFLWLAGPLRRAEIKRLTFDFGKSGGNGLAHCLRWFAPDPIFELFDPPVPTDPPALCYLWRCQLMDLAKEINLAVLTINVRGISGSDLPFMVRVLRQVFGSVSQIRFKYGLHPADPHMPELSHIQDMRSWREGCREWFKGRKNSSSVEQWRVMSTEKSRMCIEDLEREMDGNRGFFDQVDCAYPF